MPAPDSHTEISVSSDAAENFINHYYQNVNKRTANLKNFYVTSSTKYSNITADISINGLVVPTADEYLKLLESQGDGVHYDIESFDTHVTNPTFQYGAPTNIVENARLERNGSRMSLAVVVVGKVQFGKGKDAPAKMFNETFMLVPNWDAMSKNPPRGIQKWLILSQNFRAL